MSDKPVKTSPLLIGDRPLPHSADAERAVLSCLLQDPAATMDIAIQKLEREEAMYMPAHRRLFACILELRHESPNPDKIDYITIAECVDRKGYINEIGGENFLTDLYNLVPTTANFDSYLKIVVDNYVLRRLIHSCSQMVTDCYEAEDGIDDIVDKIESEVMTITQAGIDVQSRSVSELLHPAVKFMEAMHKKDPSALGLPTGFIHLDNLITGLRPGELFVLAARPSIGKTTLAMNIARNVAIRANASVGFFSLEMGAEQVVMRLLCSEARISIKDIRDGNLSAADWGQKVMGACDKLKDANIYIDDTPQISSLELRQKARRMKLEHNIQLIIIDYLQLMRPSGFNKNSNREQEVAKMSSDLKALARELDVPVMVLCQLNRAAEQGGQPKISNLRESGAIEQDADIVALLHRERETDNETAAEQIRTLGYMESQLIIAKHRNGPTGIVHLAFYPQYTLFDTLQRINDADIPPI